MNKKTKALLENKTFRLGTIFILTLLPFGLLYAGFYPDALAPYLNYQGKTLNKHLLSQCADYKTDEIQILPAKEIGKNMGNLHEWKYQGKVFAKKPDEQATYCIALMLDAYLGACRASAGDNFELPTVPRNQIWQFRRDWYGFDGNEKTLVRTLVERKLGVEITNPADAKPGDLVQFWRQKSGHAVMFLNWKLNKKNEIIGINYWSTRQGTIKEATEYINGYGGSVDPKRIYIVRAFKPN